MLLAAAVAALAWANSPWASSYFALQETVFTLDLEFFALSQNLREWINEALMVLGLLAPAKPWFGTATFGASASELLKRFREAEAGDREEDAQAMLGQLEELVRQTETPLDRLQRTLHPWSSYLILPLFALANSGIALSAASLGEAASSPITHGILLGWCSVSPWRGIRVGCRAPGAGDTSAGDHLAAPGRARSSLGDRVHGLAVHHRARVRGGRDGPPGQGRHLRGLACGGIAGSLFLRTFGGVPREGERPSARPHRHGRRSLPCPSTRLARGFRRAVSLSNGTNAARGAGSGRASSGRSNSARS